VRHSKEKMILHHLVDPDFDTPDALPPGEILSAQMRTLDWLDTPLAGAAPNDKSLARAAFASLVSPDEDPNRAKKNLLALRAPEAVQHLVTMLDAYSWEFVQEAHKIRGYVVAQLLELSSAGDARIKLRAIELLGKLTEVSSFTERIEVTHKTEGAEEIEERLRARLKSLLPPQQAVQDVEVQEIAVVKHEPIDA
jgi:hypothetical protein